MPVPDPSAEKQVSPSVTPSHVRPAVITRLQRAERLSPAFRGKKRGSGEAVIVSPFLKMVIPPFRLIPIVSTQPNVFVAEEFAAGIV